MGRRRCCCGGGCSQTFHVTRCGAVWSGATVDVYDHSGGTLLASGSTDGAGDVTLSWAGSGAVFVSVAGAGTGFDDYGQTLSLICGTLKGIVIPTASGYACCNGCSLHQVNLTYTITQAGGLGCGTTSGVATHVGTNLWSLLGGVFLIKCVTDALILDLTFPYGCNVPLTSMVCDPLHMEFDVNLVNCPGFVGSGCTTMTVVLTP